ncbi:hypothetical protein QBC47DRAFT_52763 [Echria macrotheca]|uniref:Uncharacterized protein n=1 Tax=Echria macrotheca TaxID=438768 RepID=A0AAJ0B9A3_9PEZI|nr:hypothetical protein QBC47DRAFT_52763 [Echria macrotheca]
MAEILTSIADLVDSDDLPPSYTDATSSSSSLRTLRPHQSPSSSSSSFSSPSIPSPITTHLQTLPSSLRAAHLAHLSTQTATDLLQIDHLVPPISSFLSSLPSISSPSSPLAELTLVPALAVPKGWALTGAAERRREGEIVRVVRIDSPPTTSTSIPRKDSKSEQHIPRRDEEDEEDEEDGTHFSPSRAAGFDDWGRFTDETGNGTPDPARGTFFRDEKMARRLAGYLQPKQEIKMERGEIRQAVVEGKQKKGGSSSSSSSSPGAVGGWRWGRKKSEASSFSSASSSSTTPVSGPVASPAPAKGAVVEMPVVGPGPIRPQDDRVSVTVRAEEVTFRRENEWGIWESLTGFGIVVRVRVRKL